MGGTVASGTGAPMPILNPAAAGLAPPPATTPLVGGVGWSTPAVEPVMSSAFPTTTAVIGGGALAAQAYLAPQPVPVAPVPAASTDVQSVIAQLTAVLGQLGALLGALQGAATVQGGGPGQSPVQGPSSPGCSCCGTGAAPTPAQVAQAPVDAAPEQAAPPTSPGDSPPGSGDVRQRIVQAAQAELERGVKENGGEDRDATGRIREYRTAVTGPGEDPDAAEPWCADFASWVWKQAGVPFGPGGSGEDYTVAMIQKAKSSGQYRERGSYQPQPGDLVMIDWGGGTDVDHVAVVTKVEGGRVHTIGGNESDSVKSASYAIGDPRMMGFIVPTGG